MPVNTIFRLLRYFVKIEHIIQTEPIILPYYQFSVLKRDSTDSVRVTDTKNGLWTMQNTEIRRRSEPLAVLRRLGNAI